MLGAEGEFHMGFAFSESQVPQEHEGFWNVGCEEAPKENAPGMCSLGHKSGRSEMGGYSGCAADVGMDGGGGRAQG